MAQTQWSHFQTDIFRHVAENWRLLKRVRAGDTSAAPRNLVVQATAGSGKSSTIRQACTYIPDARVDVVSFTARVAAEAQARLPANASSTTLHAVGKRALEQHFGRRFRKRGEGQDGDGELAPDKLRRIVAKCKELGLIDPYVPAGAICKLVDHARGVGLVPAVDARWVERALAGGDYGAEVAETLRSSLCAGKREPQPVRGVVPDTDDAWRDLMERHCVDYPQWQRLVSAAREVLRWAVQSASACIDFGDMVYVPALMPGLSFGRRDVVMVDELQDLDPVQRLMVVRMCGGAPRDRCDDQAWADDDIPTPVSGRPHYPTLFIGVGDFSQAIFSWRGAEHDSMARCARDLDCAELPLSICYRCPSSHLDLARRYAPEIEARPGAPAGEVVRYPIAGSADPACPLCIGVSGGCQHHDRRVGPRTTDFQPGDAVICRLNAPLVKVAYWLMRARVPCRVLGRDFGRGLVQVVQSSGGQTARAVLERLSARLLRQEAADARDKSLDGEPSEATQRLRDQIEVAQSVSEALATRLHGSAGDDVQLDAANVTADQVVRELEHLFSEDGDLARTVTLSSIHKFKGGEADRVWWLDEENCHRQCRQEWQATELEHLCFVALTRSRHSILFFNSDRLE